MLQAAGAILAGGESSRMGTDKAMLLFHNETLLERGINKLKSIFPEVIVVNNRKSVLNLPRVKEISDIYEHRGPLGGIHAALKSACYDKVFVAACDMPFWNIETARLLVLESVGYDAAVPFIDGRYEPLLAVYSKSCLNIIERMLKQNMNSVREMYKKINVNSIALKALDQICLPDKAFRNLNTPEEWNDCVNKKD